MNPVDRLHDRLIHPARIAALVKHLIACIPQNARLLDVGCGDGRLSEEIAKARPDLEVTGIEVEPRADARIEVLRFDGLRLPFAPRSWDVVLMVDVLHHTPDPRVLLAEANRVSSTLVVIKDHLLEGWLARSTLEFMDQVGNARHGVALPGSYWPRETWLRVIGELELQIDSWTTQLRLYPWPLTLFFDRSLHFVARLRTATQEREESPLDG